MVLRLDEIGNWTEVKLDIVRSYASAYSKILSAQARPRLHHVYIDAFAGAGVHLSKTRGEVIPGSPLNALAVEPPFRECHLIDFDGEKAQNLRELIGDREDVIDGSLTATAASAAGCRVRSPDTETETGIVLRAEGLLDRAQPVMPA